MAVRPALAGLPAWSWLCPAWPAPPPLLRPWQATDAPVLAAAWRDPVIRDRLRVPEPAGEDAASHWISQREHAWAEGRSVDLAVTDRPSGDVIGEVGLSRLDPVRRAALVGWWIAEGWRGRGRAVEAVRLVLDWVLSEGPLQAVMAEIDSENLASAAVAPPGRDAQDRRASRTDRGVRPSGCARVCPHPGRGGVALAMPRFLPAFVCASPMTYGGDPLEGGWWDCGSGARDDEHDRTCGRGGC